MIVVDSSAVVDLLVGAVAMRERLSRSLARGVPLVAPDLLTSEVDSALSGIVRGGGLGWVDARQALDAYAALPFRRLATHPLRNRILELSRGLSAYDATYVALAEALGATLVTTDRKLARAVRTVAVDVPA
jgi:predicted nucleic acid-binding protein